MANPITFERKNGKVIASFNTWKGGRITIKSRPGRTARELRRLSIFMTGQAKKKS